MKLRIKGNSVRLRLGQSEVRRLAADGMIEESIAFGPSDGQRLSYVICISSESPSITAKFADARIVVRVPSIDMYQWVTTDQVGIHANQRIDDNGGLRILIEKDFECIDAPPGEPQEDAFPHPQLDVPCGPVRANGRSA